VSTGIYVFSLLFSVYGTVIVSNKIRNESLDIEVNSPNNVEVHLNNLLGKGANAPELVCCRAVESLLTQN